MRSASTVDDARRGGDRICRRSSAYLHAFCDAISRCPSPCSATCSRAEFIITNMALSPRGSPPHQPADGAFVAHGAGGAAMQPHLVFQRIADDRVAGSVGKHFWYQREG